MGATFDIFLQSSIILLYIEYSAILNLITFTII